MQLTAPRSKPVKGTDPSVACICGDSAKPMPEHVPYLSTTSSSGRKDKSAALGPSTRSGCYPPIIALSSLSVSLKIFPFPTANTSFPGISVPANLHPQLRIMTEAWGKLRECKKSSQGLFQGHTSLKKPRRVLLGWLQFSCP